MMEGGSYFINDSPCLCYGINDVRKWLMLSVIMAGSLFVLLWIDRVQNSGRCCLEVRVLGLVVFYCGMNGVRKWLMLSDIVAGSLFVRLWIDLVRYGRPYCFM